MNTSGVSGHLGHIIPPFTQNVHSTSTFQDTCNLFNTGLIPDIRYFLQAMVRPKATHSTSPKGTNITTQNCQQGLRKIPNRTSFSPSGHHITQNKILATDFELSQILARADTKSFTNGFFPSMLAHYCTVYSGKRAKQSYNFKTQSDSTPGDRYKL